MLFEVVNAMNNLMPEHADEHHSVEWTTTRPIVSGLGGVISSGHPLVSMAGMRMLLSGGNAFDAAAAAGFAAAVIEPTASYTLCGECVAMLHDPRSDRTVALSGQGPAPALATIATLAKSGFPRIPTGPGPNAHLSFTVPGAVDAYLTLLETFGTRTIVEVLAPALEYAEQGFPMYEYMRRMLSIPETRAQFALYPPGGEAAFYPAGRTPDVGERFRQPALAQTLKKLIAAGAQSDADRLTGIRAVRERFYRGDIAATIGAFSEKWGGLLRAADLANYRAQFESPLAVTFAGREIVGQSAWTQAPVVMQALGMLATFNLKAMGHNSSRYVHTLAEVLKLAFADRERYYGDSSEVPLAELLSPTYLRERAEIIRSDRAMPEAPPSGEVAGPARQPVVPQPSAGSTAPISSAAHAEDGTTHIACIDREGGMIALTPSGGVFRKSVFCPDLGCTLSTRSEMFNLEDGHPNALAPGKRPRTTLISYLICEGGRPVATVGCPGGDDQGQADLQIILNMLVFGMNPQQAVEAPRFATETLVDSFWPHPYKPGVLSVEPGIPERTRAELQALGHTIEVVGACGIGAVVTCRDPDTGVLSAGADPRRPTYALAF
jgi:gamma-glutamyltranspeptidase/glutathione hydrolase